MNLLVGNFGGKDGLKRCVPEVEEKEVRHKMYPERLSAEVEKDIVLVERIMEGKEELLELTDEQRAKLLKWEDALGKELEGIAEEKMNADTFCPQYFLSDKGKVDFRKLFGEVEVPTSIEGINLEFYKNKEKLAGLPDKTVDEVFSASIDFFQQELENQVLAGLQDDGSLKLDALNYLERRSVIMKPESGRAKLERLQALRKHLNNIKRGYSGEADNLLSAKAEVAAMYLARVNERLANFYPALFSLQKKVAQLGADALDEDEKFLFENIRGPSNKPRTLHRLDKLVFGSGSKLDEKGNYISISEEIMAKLSAVIDEQADFGKVQEESIRARGLDPQKVLAANVTAEQRKAWGKRILAAYGVLSDEPEETYVKARVKPAADGKWQYVVRADRKTKAINSKQKVVLDSAREDDIIRGLLVTCGHEIEGHVIQHVNKEKIPLRLFKVVGGDRRQLLSEGGAVYNEDRLVSEFFGYSKPHKSLYLLAMEAKRLGGDFMECLMAAYSVILSNVRSKYNLAIPKEQEAFKKEITKELKDLVNRVQRVFKGVSLSDRSGYLPETKDSVYLEQDILMQKLAERGLTKLAYVGGMNLRNIATLMKLGILKIDDIVEPKMVTREIWKEIEPNYRLEVEDNEVKTAAAN